MELLIRVVDKERSGDAALDAQRTMSGDVIACMPDGHAWGREEMRNPEWRIVRVPGMLRAEAEELAAPERLGALAPGLARKRACRLDLEALDAISGGTLLAPRMARKRQPDAVIPRHALAPLAARKAPLRDSRFVGPRGPTHAD